MTSATPTPTLSVLDTAPIWAAGSATESLHSSVELAGAVERLGYRRYWLAEHHNTPSLATSATAVMVDRLASATDTLRVGSGGVMLPNHPPLVVAEQFGTLAALHPERIDLGIGRAPGTDPATALALRRTSELGGAGFEHQIVELMGYMDAGSTSPIRAVPAPRTWPPLFLLGTSANSAVLAGALGVSFAFAHHLRPDATAGALRAYRDAFRPSAAQPEAYSIVCAVASVADDDERADWLLGPMKHAFALGAPRPFVGPEEAAAHPYDEAQRLRVRAQFGTQIVGSVETAAQQVDHLLGETGADELMALTVMHDHAERVRSYELLARTVREPRRAAVSAW